MCLVSHCMCSFRSIKYFPSSVYTIQIFKLHRLAKSCHPYLLKYRNCRTLISFQQYKCMEFINDFGVTFGKIITDFSVLHFNRKIPRKLKITTTKQWRYLYNLHTRLLPLFVWVWIFVVVSDVQMHGCTIPMLYLETSIQWIA